MHSTPRDASDPRRDYTLDIHYSWRLTMCGHVRWKGPVNYQHVVPKGVGCVLLWLAWRPPSTLHLASKRCVGGVEEAGCVPCINAAVLIERLVVLAKRESKGVGVDMSAVVFCKEFVLRTFFFSTHACCQGDFPLYFQ